MVCRLYNFFRFFPPVDSFDPSQGAKAGHALRDALQEAIDALGTVKEGGEETVEEEKVEASGESGPVAFAFDRGITRALKVGIFEGEGKRRGRLWGVE